MILALTSLALASLQAPTFRDPLVVIDRPGRPARDRFDGVANPRLAKLGDRVLLSSYEHTAHYGSYGTHILRSDDGGVSWQRTAHLTEARDAELFTIGDTTYLLSVDGDGRGNRGPVRLRASKDGRTWEGRNGSAAVPLRGDDAAFDGPTALFLASGRVWCVFRPNRVVLGKGERATSVSVASASIADELLDPKSWRWSNDFELSDARVSGFYPDIIAMVTEDQTPRLFVKQDGTVVATLDVVSEGWRVRHRYLEPSFEFPKSVSSARLVQEGRSGPYWTVSVGSNPTPTPESKSPRNVLMLHRAERVTEWRDVVLVDDQRSTHAQFKSVQATDDGEDLLVVANALFPSAEDAPQLRNSVVFLRVPRFRAVEAWEPIVIRDRR